MDLPKSTLENLDEVSEEMKEWYVESENGFNLTIPGMKPESEVNKVMESLRKERADHKLTLKKLKTFGENTPEKILKLQNSLTDFELQIGKKDEDLTTRLQTALDAKLIPYNEKEKAWSIEKEDMLTELNDLKADKINGALMGWISSKMSDSKNGLRPESSKDIYARAKLQGSGLVYNSDAKEFLDADKNDKETWFAHLLNENPHWRLNSTSANARGGNAGIESNPWSKGKENYTEQAKIQNANPEKALRLKKSAGY